MEATVDAVGRIVLPKPLRDLLGLVAGSTVDVSRYGAGLALIYAALGAATPIFAVSRAICWPRLTVFHTLR